MKKQYFINANIVDPHNSINEIGGLIISEDGKEEEEINLKLIYSLVLLSPKILKGQI